MLSFTTLLVIEFTRHAARTPLFGNYPEFSNLKKGGLTEKGRK